jgi:hypothetical protein
MLKVSQEDLDRLESQYSGIVKQIHQFENASLPSCPKCGAIDTADVQVDVIGRTTNIAAATTKFKLLPNDRPSKYFCNVCEEYFN